MQATLSEYEGDKPKKKSVSMWTDRTVDAMKPGEFGWADSWIVEIGGDRKMWIRKNGTVHPKSGGSASMMVRRTKEGVEIRTSPDSKFRIHDKPLIMDDLLPVERLI